MSVIFYDIMRYLLYFIQSDLIRVFYILSSLDNLYSFNLSYRLYTKIYPFALICSKKLIDTLINYILFQIEDCPTLEIQYIDVLANNRY